MRLIVANNGDIATDEREDAILYYEGSTSRVTHAHLHQLVGMPLTDWLGLRLRDAGKEARDGIVGRQAHIVHRQVFQREGSESASMIC
jgi:hypothetical protein